MRTGPVTSKRVDAHWLNALPPLDDAQAAVQHEIAASGIVGRRTSERKGRVYWSVIKALCAFEKRFDRCCARGVERAASKYSVMNPGQ